jgi:hypothetical protein
MRKAADIEDIQDIPRRCRESWYYRKDSVGADGIPTIYGLLDYEEARRGRILIGEWSPTINDFLDSWGDHGPWKNRMVEVRGTVLYVRHRELEPHEHGVVPRNMVFKSFNLPNVFDDMTHEARAPLYMNHTRTRFGQALALLEAGTRIGCALSDNYGVVTTEYSPDPILVFKTHEVGDIKGGVVYLKDQWKYLRRVENQLCTS